jgi:polyribonucleotide nucleotidyltransferase
MDFGAFVEILPGTDGLVHISQLANERVKQVTDVVNEGDEILVKVLGIDKQGKIRLSRKGVTGIQMDIKVGGVSEEMLKQTLTQARDGRIHILDEMDKVISEPRAELSPYAPKTTTMEINPDKIRDLIGPQGKVIRAIQTETETRIDVDDSGKVFIYAINSAMAEGQDHGLWGLCRDSARDGRSGPYISAGK